MPQRFKERTAFLLVLLHVLEEIRDSAVIEVNLDPCDTVLIIHAFSMVKLSHVIFKGMAYDAAIGVAADKVRDVVAL